MLSGWHPYAFVCSNVLIRDKSASPLRKEKAALVWDHGDPLKSEPEILLN